MAKTTTQLATAVLKRLAVIAADETPQAQDANDVKDYYADIFQELQAQDLAYWDEASIPEEAFRPLVDYIAGQIAPDYGQARPDLEESGRFRLQILATEQSAGANISDSYF